MESTFRPVFWLMSGRAVGLLATFFVPVVLARIFDPAIFGAYKRLFLVYATLYGIAQVGLSESLYYFLPRFPKSAGRLALNAMLGLLASGFLCFAVLFAARIPVSAWLGDVGLAPQLPLIGAFLLLMLASSVVEITMTAQKWFGLASLTYLGCDVLRAGFLVLPAVALGSLQPLLIGAVAFALLRLLAAVAWLARRFTSEFRTDGALFKNQLGYALPFALAVLVEMVQSSYHQYVVSFRFDAATFAVFSVALLQIPLVDQTATAASSVLMVRMGEKLQQGQAQAVRELWHDAICKLALIFFPLVALLLVAGREVIVLLFTERYLESVPLFRLSSLAILLTTLQTDSVLRVLAQTRFLLAQNALRLILVAALIDSALTRFGLPGAILLPLLVAAFAKGLALARIGRLQGMALSALLPWRRLALVLSVTSAAGLAALGVHAALQWPALPNLAATTAVLSAVYLALSTQAGLLPRLDYGSVRAWLRGAPGVA
jgi:O-antigen/teichoic acid export membrane protein